ncbi:MAG: O-acetyl-ADP-ribose deacetylase [Kiloniellales bacterium]
MSMQWESAMSSDRNHRIELFQGDITRLEVDAIVNAANEGLRPGGGVCGAIHRAAGQELAEACAKLGHCPTGESRATDGYRLKARRVIHSVGPVWGGGDRDEDGLLASCYRTALKIARQEGLKSIAFPAISTGVYGFPLERATRIAVETVRDFLAEDSAIDKAIFVVFGADAERAYRNELGL